MELEIPLNLKEDKNAGLKKTFKYLLAISVFIIFIAILFSIVLGTSRLLNEKKLESFVFKQYTTDMTIFINPNNDNYKNLTNEASFKILTEDKSIQLENFESVLAKFFIEIDEINEEEISKIVKSYEIKLLEHNSNKIKEFNVFEENVCSGFGGCGVSHRLNFRKVLEENIKNKTKEKKNIFLKNIIKSSVDNNQEIGTIKSDENMMGKEPFVV